MPSLTPILTPIFNFNLFLPSIFSFLFRLISLMCLAMARRQRFHTPTATYHVMLRGNDAQDIFFSDADRVKMCLLLQQGVERFSHCVEAFCFMSNHVHLAIRVAETSISRIMHHLAFRYTQYINRLYGRIGHLFQGRFKSVLVDDEDYLKELIRYIHLNPVRAKLTTLPQQYIWSSHRAYLGSAEFCWLTKDRVLQKFDCSKKDTANFEKYVLQGIGVETNYDFKSGSISGMVGNKEFVEEILRSTFVKRMEIKLPDLITKVCEVCDLSKEELCSPGKTQKYSQARALLSFFVREIDSISLVDLAQALSRDTSSLAKLAGRFEVKIATNPLTLEKVDILRRWVKEHYQKMPKCQA